MGSGRNDGVREERWGQVFQYHMIMKDLTPVFFSSTIASAYLSTEHRDQMGDGCTLAALGAEAARHGSALRGAFTQGVRAAIDLLTKLLTGKSRRAKRDRALAIYAGMVGALVLARAVDDADLSEEVMKAVLASIKRAELYT